MRRIKYFVAVSLDGYIAGPEDQIDWLFTDQDYGFTSFLKTVDTVLIGRRTYEKMLKLGQESFEEKMNYIFSKNKFSSCLKNVTWVDEDPVAFVGRLRRQTGKDIWVVGGGILFGSLLQEYLIDDLILAVHPAILGRGIPFVTGIRHNFRVDLKKIKQYQTGLVMLYYSINATSGKT